MRTLVAYLPFLVVGPVAVFIGHLRHQVGDHATGYEAWLMAVRLVMRAPDLNAFLAQAYIAASTELFCLYAILRVRGTEVYVFSHLRFVCATILTGVVGAAYYHGVIWLASGRPLTLYLVFGLLSLPGIGVAGMFQAAVVLALDAMGTDPVVKDLARKAKMGKSGDFNSWVIRRWGQFNLVWFLLLPGLVLNSPAPPLVAVILACVASLPAAYTLVRNTVHYAYDG